MVLLRRLAEADAGIEQNAAERHAGRRREIERAFEEALDVVENVDRPVRPLAVVHDDDRRAGFGDRVRHARIALQSPDVVDDRGAEPRRLARHCGFAGVDGDGCVETFSQGPEHRRYPAKLLFRGNGSVAGPGRFAADVDDRRALGNHRVSARDGGLGVEMPSAVGKRIRRHVENAHELGRASQRGEERVAMDNAAVDAHGRRLSPLGGFRNLLPNPRR